MEGVNPMKKKLNFYGLLFLAVMVGLLGAGSLTLSDGKIVYGQTFQTSALPKILSSYKLNYNQGITQVR